jgi:hypothetical protein
LWCREYRVGEGDLVNGVYSPNTLAKTLSKTLGYTLAKQGLKEQPDPTATNREPTTSIFFPRECTVACAKSHGQPPTNCHELLLLNDVVIFGHNYVLNYL